MEKLLIVVSCYLYVKFSSRPLSFKVLPPVIINIHGLHLGNSICVGITLDVGTTIGKTEPFIMTQIMGLRLASTNSKGFLHVKSIVEQPVADTLL